MSDLFFLVVSVIIAAIGLLLIMAKVLTYIKCTVSMNAPVVKLETDETYFRGVKHTYYHPVVEYIVDGESYTQTAPFRTLRKTKYAMDSKMEICYNPKNPEEMRFVGHPFPLHIGAVCLFIGAVLIWCCFL